MVVPSSLAYGHSGVSRFDAFRMGLANPVPRDQDIFYDVEVLRCNDVEVEVPKSSSGKSGGSSEEKQTVTVQACCVEDKYPCKVSEPKEQ